MTPDPAGTLCAWIHRGISGDRFLVGDPFASLMDMGNRPLTVRKVFGLPVVWCLWGAGIMIHHAATS